MVGSTHYLHACITKESKYAEVTVEEKHSIRTVV